MAVSIPTMDIQEFFTKYLNKQFVLKHFDLPEPNYENGNISLFETIIICLFCCNVKPLRILEFGTFNGRTTANISANIPDTSKIITVDLPKNDMKNTKFALEGINKNDKHDELGYVGLRNKRYNKQLTHIKKKIFQLWMDTAMFPIGNYYNYFDFIFVDASHSYENCRNDSINVLQMVKNNGFILWHDYNGWPGVSKALNEIYDVSTHQEYFINIEGTSMVLYYANSYQSTQRT